MADEDPIYTAWLRKLPCCAPECGTFICGVAHHRDGAGLGLRAHDHRAIPLCPKCHSDFHGATGVFKGWDRGQRAAWQDKQIATYREAFTIPRGPGDTWTPPAVAERPSKILPRRGL